VEKKPRRFVTDNVLYMFPV